MKIILPRNGLLRGIQTVQNAVATKNTIPILANVLLEAREKKLELVATDLDLGIRCSVPAEVVDKGSLTVNARKLSDICRELPDANVDLETDENNRLILICEKSQFKMNGLPKDDFPILPEVKKEKVLKLEASLLSEMVRKTLYAVSTDETRYVLNGVLFVVEGGKLRMVATDGHRLALAERKIDGKVEGKVMAILPTKSLNEFSKIIPEGSKTREKEGKEKKEEGPCVEIAVTENQAKFTVGDVEIVTRLIEGQFPNYEQVIPKETDKVLEADTSLLAAATRRVSLLASEKSNSVRYKITQGKLTIQANAPDVGEAREDLDVSYSGAEIQIAFNARYLQDALKNLGTDKVQIELTQPLNPVVLRPKGDKNHLCVVMPMRV